MRKIYYVSKQGSDQNIGTKQNPFATIQKAAEIAVAGDKVIVHKGEYREWVRPKNGGLNDSCRIIFEAAKGEHVIIKGSEVITGWEKMEGSVWKVELPNEMFGSYNPYKTKIEGDWLVSPKNYDVHTGEIYLNGSSLYEAVCFEDLKNPKKRFISSNPTWGNRECKIQDPEQTVFQWFSEVTYKSTILYVNFGEYDPNKELVEINVRQCCFYPERTGLNYITVRGFEMAHAATQWAPPTSNQIAMIGPNWSKGWIIENNIFHDSKCCAISLGKEETTGDNEFTRGLRKPGYQYQMEAVFRAKAIGWSKERIGSHIVRNNIIYDCGQTGIVGHLGCIFSEIYENEIYHIATKHEFWGHEIAGIKLHAAIDVQIHNNHIHHCTLGTWLDWQAQGTRVSCNLYHHNDRDFMIEVTHGPYLIDNNIFASAYNFDNAAQGGAYVHNLCFGFMNQYPVLDRSTPYHLPHSTEVLGTVLVYGFDDRWYQNILIGGNEKDREYGTAVYDGAPISIEEFIERYLEKDGGDVETFAQIKQPVYIEENVYLNGAKAFCREQNYYCNEWNPKATIISSKEEVFLEITLPEQMFELLNTPINTERLGAPRIVEVCYENPDTSPLTICIDLLGKEIKEKAISGPLQELKPGKNRIKLCKNHSHLVERE